jgi:hypothetical protein
MIARVMILNAMQEIGALAVGESMADADAQVGLTRLNSLLDRWQTERLTIGFLARTTFLLVSGEPHYAIGATPGADVTFPIHPVRFHAISLLPAGTGQQEIPLEMLTMDKWVAIGDKALTSTWPTKVYYNPVFPLGSLRFWPVPTDATARIVLYTPLPIPAGATVHTDLALPPGYEEAIRYNLAVRLAPVFGRPIDPELKQMATDALSQVKRTNTRRYDLRVDEALQPASGAWDYRSG